MTFKQVKYENNTLLAQPVQQNKIKKKFNFTRKSWLMRNVNRSNLSNLYDKRK